MPSLILENSDDPSALSTIHSLLELDVHSRLVDPELVSQYLDSVERTSISSVGLRDEASYRNILGRNVGRALRTSDTARAGLGHVMMQTQGQQGRSYTVGGATAKGKIWSTRYSSLREYNDWIDEVAGRIWFPRIGTSGPVLPNVSRGSRLIAWPDSIVVAVDFAPELYARDVTFHGPDGMLLASLDDVLLAPVIDDEHAGETLTLTATLAGTEDDEPFWVGQVNVSGEVGTIRGDELNVRHGYSPLGSMATFLTHYPPSIHFLNGQRIEGHVVYDERGPNIGFSPAILTPRTWDGTDITAEAKKTAAERNNGKVSVHEAMEQMFRERFADTRRRPASS